MFAGFVALGDTLAGAFLVKHSQESPVNADSLPTFRVYGPGGLMQHGTGIARVLDSGLTGSYQYAITADPGNGYEVGTCYHVFINATVLGTAVAYEQSFIVT